MGQVVEEALQDILDTYFATPGDFYVGLCSDLTVATDAVYTDLTEVSGSGYAKIALTTITVATRGTDDRKATGNQVTFSATGTWTTAASWFLIKTTVASGTYTLIAWNNLSVSQTLQSGESIDVTPVINANG